MQLWMIEDMEFVKAALANEVLYCTWDHSDGDFAQAYLWMIQQMNARGIKCDGPPMWAWQRWSDESQKPVLVKGDYACIELDVPDELVLLSDYSAWFCVVNGWYRSFSEAEDEDVYKHGEPAPEVIHASWPRIFDLNIRTPDGWCVQGVTVQAAFPCLKKEWIKHIEYGVRLFDWLRDGPDDESDESGGRQNNPAPAEAGDKAVSLTGEALQDPVKPRITDQQIEQMCDDGVSRFNAIKLLCSVEGIRLSAALRRIKELNLDWYDRGAGQYCGKGLYSPTYQKLAGIDSDGIMQAHGRAIFQMVADMNPAEQRGFMKAFSKFKAEFGLAETVFVALGL